MSDPKKGTGKKPKGSGRRLYTDENPKDTVSVKFSTVQDIKDTLSKTSFKSKSHKRQSQIINLIHQRARAAYQNAKDPKVKARLKRAFDYATERKEASKRKTKRMDKTKNENILRLMIMEELQSASESLNRKNCSPYRHSLAWIEPSGKVHILKNDEPHLVWITRRASQEGWSKGGRDELRWDEYALEKGWVAAANGTNFRIFGNFDDPFPDDAIPEGAMRGIIEVLVGCASELIRDPENEEVRIERQTPLPDGTISYGRSTRYRTPYPGLSVADFVQRYGTEADVEKFYSNLMMEEELQSALDEKKKKRKKKSKRKKAGTESSKESSLRDWFGRKGAKGKKKGWVDCNAPDGKGGYKACGRSKGEKRKKYPACRPTPGACKERGKGKSWGKKAKKSSKKEGLTMKNDLRQIVKEELQRTLFKPGLMHHVENRIPVTENIYRAGSPCFFNVIKQARMHYKSGLYEVLNDEERDLLENSDLGEWVIVEGERVPLDFPLFIDESLDEAKKKKKKDPPIGKPTRNTGSGKKYKVYVRNKKTGRIKKITYGDAKGGLKGGWNSAEARKSFAARHNCAEKKDRTKAGYWACRAHKDFGPGVGRFW